MSKLKTYSKLSSVLKLIVDNRGKTVPTSESGFPLIATNCIKHTSIFPIFENIRYVNEETLNTWFRAHLEPNDILFVNKGTPGRCCLVPDPVSFCVAQDMIGLRSDKDKIDFRYLFMVLRSEFIQRKVENFHVGLVIPHFKKGDIDNILIPRLESRQMEAKVGKVYIDFSFKIELNNKINAELEAMAKTLYDYWFVQFNFPNENGKPYKSSGGEMIWSKELKRDIPKGWEIENLQNNPLTNLIKPRINFFEGKKTYLATADVVNNEINFEATKITFENRESRANMQPISNSVWFAKMKNTKKVLYFGDYSNYFLEEFILSTGFAGIKCKEKFYLEYVWGVVNSNHFEMIKDRLSNGATQEAINNDSMAFIPLIIPNDSVLKEYHKKTFDIYKKIYLNQIENQKLAELRNFLLPMLMNGQIVVE